MCLGARRVRAGKRDARKTRGVNATCNSPERTRTKAPSSQRSPDRPGWSRPAEGSSWAGESWRGPRGVDRLAGILILSVGRETRAHHYSYPTLWPLRASARVSGSACARGLGSLRRAGRTCPGKESGGCPAGPRERRGDGLPRAPGGRGSPRPLQRRSPHPLPGPLSALGFSRQHRAPLTGPRQHRAARVPRQTPLCFRDPRPISTKVCFPLTLPRPERGQSSQLSPARPRRRFALPPSRTAAAAWAWAGPCGQGGQGYGRRT